MVCDVCFFPSEMGRLFFFLLGLVAMFFSFFLETG